MTAFELLLLASWSAAAPFNLTFHKPEIANEDTEEDTVAKENVKVDLEMHYNETNMTDLDAKREGRFRLQFGDIEVLNSPFDISFKSVKVKNTEATDGGWSGWSPFSSCSATCGSATKRRERTCNGGAQCPGSNQETVNCALQDCAILVLNVKINEIDESLKAIGELSAVLKSIEDRLKALSNKRKKRSSDEQSSDETKLLELIDEVTIIIEKCGNGDSCESNEIKDITQDISSASKKVEETGKVSSMFQNSFNEKKAKLDTKIEEAEKTQGEEKEKVLADLAVAIAEAQATVVAATTMKATTTVVTIMVSTTTDVTTRAATTIAATTMAETTTSAATTVVTTAATTTVVTTRAATTTVVTTIAATTTVVTTTAATTTVVTATAATTTVVTTTAATTSVVTTTAATTTVVTTTAETTKVVTTTAETTKVVTTTAETTMLSTTSATTMLAAAITAATTMATTTCATMAATMMATSTRCATTAAKMYATTSATTMATTVRCATTATTMYATLKATTMATTTRCPTTATTMYKTRAATTMATTTRYPAIATAMYKTTAVITMATTRCPTTYKTTAATTMSTTTRYPAIATTMYKTTAVTTMATTTRCDTTPTSMYATTAATTMATTTRYATIATTMYATTTATTMATSRYATTATTMYATTTATTMATIRYATIAKTMYATTAATTMATTTRCPKIATTMYATTIATTMATTTICATMTATTCAPMPATTCAPTAATMAATIATTTMADTTTTGAISAYCSISTDHTMCKYSGPSTDCKAKTIKKGLSDTDKQAIVDQHNTLRRKVAKGEETRGNPGPQPAASDMLLMVWDEELAAIAQRWADQCTFGHDEIRNTEDGQVGQNVAIFSSPTEIPDNALAYSYGSAITSWYEEVDNPGFKKDNVDPFVYSKGAGHYTQVVWASSRAVGCGSVYYKFGSGDYRQYIICNYFKRGNMKGAAMYSLGDPCSACPSGYPTRSDGLCTK